MATAAAAVQTIAGTTPERLPRFNSAQSGAIFSRITSPENMDIYRNKTLPLEARFPDFILYGSSLSTITKTYLATALEHKTTSDELIELTGANLRATQLQLDIVKEFLPTMSKQDPSYEVRLAGLRQMQDGLASVAVGSTIMLADEEKEYGPTPDGRSRLLAHCRESLPAIAQHLRPATQRELELRLAQIAQDPKLGKWSTELRRLHEDVRAAIARPGLDLSSDGAIRSNP
jgi:hypothetical protein